MAAWAIVGTSKPTPRQWRTVLETLEGCTASAALPTARPAKEGERPPADEVAALWAACGPLAEDQDVSRWLRSRALDPDHADLMGTGRALPRAIPLPNWARFGNRDWDALGYRCVLPLYGASGRMESVRARRVIEDGLRVPKEVTPAGFEVRGLVMADLLARLWLGRKRLGDGTSAEDTLVRCGLVVAEGAPDFLTAVELWVSDSNEDAPATVGIFSGSWTPEIAARVPTGCRVGVIQQRDQAGEKYLEVVRKSLEGRAKVQRIRFDGRGRR